MTAPVLVPKYFPNGLPVLLYSFEEGLVVSPPLSFTNGLTWIAYIKPTVHRGESYVEEQPAITVLGDDRPAARANFGITAGNLELRVRIDGTWLAHSTAAWAEQPSLYDGEFHTIGVTISPYGLITFYVDGQAYPEGEEVHLWEPWEDPIMLQTVGSSSDTNGFVGYLAEQVSFSRDLTAEEMAAVAEYLPALWQESQAPRLLTSSPANGSSNNDKSCPVSFSYNASKIALDETVERVWVDGVLAFDVASGFQPGFTGSVGTNTDGSRSFTFDTRPVSVRKDCTVSVFSKDVAGRVGYFSFTFGIALADVTDLKARSWCGGRRIDLSWKNPPGATRVKIRRSQVSFCRFTDDAGEDVYEGAPITSFTDDGLEEGRFYYYSIFISHSAAAPYVWLHSSGADVQGLSIKDYDTRYPDYVYKLLPRNFRQRDAHADRGSNRYLLRDYCRVLQCGVNLYRGWLESLLLWRDPDLMPAGRLGEAENQRGILEAANWDLGLPPERSFDTGVLRRVALGMVPVLKEKGTCPGLVDLVKLFASWDSRCDDISDPNCGVNELFYTYDNESTITTYRAGSDLAGDSVSTAGQVTLGDTSIFGGYAFSNQDADVFLSSTQNTSAGPSLQGDGSTLGAVSFLLKRTGAPTGTVIAKLYASTGAWTNTASSPTGAPLATSNALDVSALPTAYAKTTFVFSGGNQVKLVSGTSYFVVLEYAGGNGANNVAIGTDGSAPTYAGFTKRFTSGAWSSLSSDLCFTLHKNTPVAVVPEGASFVLDALGTFACISGVSSTSGGQKVTFTKPTAKLRKEITGVGLGQGGWSFYIESIDPSSFPWQFGDAPPTFGDNAFVGLKFMDKDGRVGTVTSSTTTDTGGIYIVLTPLVDSAASGYGVFSLAADFDPAGTSYVTRKPLLKARFFAGEFSLSYDPLWDVRLRAEGMDGPWSLISALGSVTTGAHAPTPADVVVWVRDVHEDLGVVSDVGKTSLEDATKAWAPNEWVGYYLLPNWGQRRVFRITGNTATRLSVDDQSGPGLSDLSAPGANYVILDERNALKYARLAALLPSFVPHETRAYIKFENAL